MSHIENNLLNGEEIVYQGKLHWMAFSKTAFFFAFAIIGFASKSIGVGGFFIVLAAINGLLNFLNMIGSEFVVTNKRLVCKSGVIRRHSYDTQLSKVEGVGVGQGIFGRIFGYGNLIVNGTGNSKSTFGMLANPNEFRKQLQQTIDTAATSK